MSGLDSRFQGKDRKMLKTPVALAVLAAIGLTTPAQAAPLDEAFMAGCVTPLIAGAPLAEEAGLAKLRRVKARGLETGARWKADETLVLSELASGAYRGCKISYDTADADERLKSRTPEEAAKIEAAYKTVSDALIASGDFVPRDPRPTAPDVTVTAVVSAKQSADGKKIVVLMHHNTKTNFAYLFAADNGNAGQ